ncbi:MAG: hypothetical protein R3F11_17510 [Verrucomicrobiales bacterium]
MRRCGRCGFRVRFGDRVHRHLFNGGALSETANLARWNARLTEIDKAIVAESARWGDYQRPAQPHTREGDWLPHLDWMAQNYWPQINGVALQRYRDAGLYPALAAPAVTPFGSGAGYGPGFSFSMANPNAGGAILYSLDGTDPRQAGGAPHPSALTYGGESVALGFASGGAALKARVFDSGSGEWSALADADFAPRRDFDQDGIDSDWELLHQLDPEDPGDAAGDGDFDGRSAAEEFAADTDPRDPASRFEITQTTVRADGSVHLIWSEQPAPRLRHPRCGIARRTVGRAAKRDRRRGGGRDDLRGRPAAAGAAVLHRSCANPLMAREAAPGAPSKIPFRGLQGASSMRRFVRP